MKLRYRQVHLDFHTSGDIEGVGKDFDPDRFGDTLAAAGVDSINLFARCHHGYLYYPSKAFPERIHPHLARPSLLPDQIAACHDRGIRAPIYVTVQWDQFTRDAHRDWMLIDEEGRGTGRGPLEAGFYDRLDVSHPGYVSFLKEHVRELFELMPVDGLWFDIVVPVFSFDARWLKAMLKEGKDPRNPADQMAYARRVIDAFKLDMARFIRGLPQHTPDCTIYFNAGHVGPRHRSSTEAYTHYEVESLASGGWGYMHFPVAQRSGRELGKPVLGMTGKFHGSWGDFHGYKNEAAMEYEVFQMLALNGACSIGDQLHPHGELDPTTYKLIGHVFHAIEAKEPWCRGAEAVTDVAVMNPEAYATAEGLWQDETHGRTDFGVVKMLTELGTQFDLITSEKDLSGYRLVVVPDEVPVDAAFGEKLKSFVEAGGAVIASHESGLLPDGSGFAEPIASAVERVGPAEFEPDFIHPGPELLDGLDATRYVMQQRALQVRTRPGTEVLAAVERPFFNRAWQHFCSHRYTPTSFQKVYPGVTEKRIGGGRVIYFAHPVFRSYHEQAPRWIKRLVRNAMRRVLPDPIVEHDGPSSLQVSLNRQPEQGRRVLHLLHYIPERRGQAFDVIEDAIPLHGLKLTVRGSAGVASVKRVPGGEPIGFDLDGETLTFTVPKLVGHAMIEIA
ncbi:beta-galactosidase trimerization domain-containing protein [Phycisphaera mikurensis]|uniref:Beta-galactosidase trimerisation domain-containing protein n=1 Tax=Phycisphaera mikurensis (strain NBRC 102666 / KCTC 22515 / FYK2301M01) TaxID=1142394 RepID=I0IIZ0_PHYMF|nr:beta-galactosidase trimerization domain-containing protein [Phycisphaera mikurensis]MBB6443075.1 hypothetical protein [Phycisphaera mikurensis]BAM05228.1 hypothetical protein PSMK_30690 [Phycisphaera mikurensis NBRC 102666]